MSRQVMIGLALAAWLASAPALAQERPEPLSTLVKMPVKEVTVFKDGHAFVLHQGKLPTDDAGDVVMDYLPTPVLGTFWAYSADQKVKLSAVVASQRLVAVEQTALSLRELLECNEGAAVAIREKPTGAQADIGLKYEATILGVPQRSSEELARVSPPNSGPRLPVKGEVILLRTPEGTKALPIDRIAEVTFKGPHKSSTTQVEFRNLLRLKLAAAPKGQPVEVGMIYVQRGLRWIPSYKLTIDGKGNASVQLEATLINELTDLEDVTAHLVIGVPTFRFQDQVDPIALQQDLAALSARSRQDSVMYQQLSNTIMTQVAGPAIAAAPPPPGLGPQAGPAERNEDLFVFPVQHVSLKKGQRMVLPVAQFDLKKYRDVYVLDVPFTPPPEVWRSVATERQAELARLAGAPKVMHKLRLTNASPYPLTTAPALILRDKSVLAQGLMTYTPVGAEVDLAVTTAVDVAVKKSDKETNRVHNAATWEDHTYARIDLEGVIKLTNHKDQPVDLEVTRYLVGNAVSADHDGKTEMVNILEDDSVRLLDQPTWWSWYSWPSWWSHFNGIGRIVWKLRLKAGEQVDLNYKWNYYWR